MNNLKKQKFFQELAEYLIDNGDTSLDEVFSEDVVDFLTRLQRVDILLAPVGSTEPAAACSNKNSKFTENGARIMKFLQQEENKNRQFTAAEIGQSLSVSSASISGSIRKLVTDEYVTKSGKSPYQYSIALKGLNMSVEE